MATTPYAETAGTRPRVRRDVLFTETPDGVIFHNADGGFRLTAKSGYRFATLLIPHLDGSRTVDEICQGFGERRRTMVGELVKALYARGFARPVPGPADSAGALVTAPAAAARFDRQIAYVDHYADDADARFARFRATRVAVLGDGQVARWCVLSLIRNGCAAVGVEPALADGSGGVPPEEFAAVHQEAAALAGQDCPVELAVLPERSSAARPAGWAAYEGYDFVLAASGPGAPGTVLPLLREGVPDGRTLLPAWTFGGRAVVGPVMTADSTGCWSCAALRLGASGGPADAAAADLWSGLALGTGTSGAQPSGPLAAMLGNLLGYEVFRLVTGALPAETRGQLLIQDAASFDVASEHLLPHPRCPFCAAGAPETEPVDLAAAPARPVFLPTVATAPDDDAAQGPLAELERRSALVRPHAGVFTRYADEPLTQTPLKVGAVVLGLGPGGPRTVTAFDVHHTAGARLRALNVAATVYAEHVAPRADAADAGVLAGVPAVDPEALTVASGTGGTGAGPVWTLATSLVTKEAVRVPAGAVRPFGADNGDRRFEPTRAGAGAGADLPEAAAAGLLSALAHDALRRAVRGDGDVRAIAPAVFGADPETTFLLRSAAHLGVRVQLLDLGERSHSGASVVLARTESARTESARTETAGATEAHGPARWAVGAALDLTAAAVDAVRDLLGAAQLAAEDSGSAGAAPDTGDPLLRDLDAALVPVTRPEPAEGPGAPVDWVRVLERLAADGRDALVVPTHGADLPAAGIHTVRVLLTRAVTDAR
ncbi:TOMM precursor leader peptide-binding protein [Streptomyces sp. NBC_01754]|uniref:TOMM precursor leader peptide-binding protein n=1 Tax=Streptomyces sp. NBC_01754 TaxID=2975930 RepID=UPI002DDC125B|nr:TOMM precursor leader peptide-binding protein [Streptomyces sp. NBC_01754]WSC95496.1 TOMM precursor leader peptide-binding protein [Streptomyces sp. NBC_01754]